MATETKDELHDPAAIDPVLTAYLAGDPTAPDMLVATFGSVVRDAITRFLAFRVRNRMDLAG